MIIFKSFKGTFNKDQGATKTTEDFIVHIYIKKPTKVNHRIYLKSNPDPQR